MTEYKSPITGHLEIVVTENSDSLEGQVIHWKEILIHGDPKGLKSLGKLLIEIADLDQESLTELPIGAREHVHLRPKNELSNNSNETIVGRLDAKGTGAFPTQYILKNNL
jgi:hypothetical protein